MMFKVGLSGNRFSGKDTICGEFERLTIPIFDADTVIRFILNYNHFIIEEVRKSLGDVYYYDGKLDLTRINSDRKFGKVLQILESELFSTYQKFENKNEGSLYTVFNCSVLFDTDWYKKMNYNVSVYAPFVQRAERAKKILQRPYNQITMINTLLCTETDELTKNKKADVVIHNYNEFNTRKAVHDIDQRMINNYLYTQSTYSE